MARIYRIQNEASKPEKKSQGKKAEKRAGNPFPRRWDEAAPAQEHVPIEDAELVRSEEGFKDNLASPASMDAINAHWRYGGEECGYVKSLLLHPLHDDLRWGRLRYFLYWRRRVYEGACLETDAGYVWLHALELLVVDDDPDENHDCLVRMRDAYRGQNRRVDGILSSACRYFELVHGLEIEDAEDLDRQYRTIRINRILSSDRFVPLSPDDLSFITGLARSKSADHARIVSAALHEIGRGLGGKSVLDMCDRLVDMKIAMPFREDMLGSLIPPVVLRCRDVKGSRMFADLAKGLHKACAARLAGKSAPMTGSMSGFQGVLDRCVEAWRDGRLDAMTTPYRKSKPSIGFAGSPAVPLDGSAIPSRRDGTWPSYRFVSRMADYRDIPMPYALGKAVPNSRTPCYSRMTLDEYSFYQSWKDSVLRGEPAESIEGFVWLLANEIIHDDSLDPVSAMEALRLCRLVAEGGSRAMVESVMADWCIFNGLEADVSELLCDSARVNVLATAALTSDPPGRLSSGLIARLCMDECSDVEADLVNAAVGELYRRYGNSLGELFSAAVSESNIKVFESCACMPASAAVRTLKDMDGAIGFLSGVRNVVRSVQKSGVARGSAGLGSKNRDIVKEAARAALYKRSIAESSKKSVKLDMEAVNAAAEDLEVVTSLMNVAEETEKPAGTSPAKHSEETSGGDPWKHLASRLSPEQIRYISECLEGRRPDLRMERAVNEAAMDMVGDVVVEDGRAVEDYADRLEALVKSL